MPANATHPGFQARVLRFHARFLSGLFYKASFAAMASIVAAISRSSTCQARGVVSSGAAKRAPNPRQQNHSALAASAPTANHHRSTGPRGCRERAEQPHRGGGGVGFQPGQPQSPGGGGGGAGLTGAAVPVG